MGSITTATDISFEKLTEYAGLLAELEEKIKQRYMIGWKK